MAHVEPGDAHDEMRERSPWEGVRIEMADCEATLLAEIADPAFTRKDVAKTYALALRSSERERGLIDWSKVNRAIIARWSPSALQWIKQKAWSGKAFGYEELTP